ncbi:putative ABC transporter ATP-binding protein [Candidatus Lokiarchaeum ossiferum]|uniref:ABC transporter ATP-binding protein n=1 Tax=Candidatus Lokiarchaeum ossiferum TaxID=2951803 RepID=A0ABY6HR97_9ARCH|nr:putative ABC transporter ATP-binding protein [Candidatus Lokiarchaeum sp. B-35]
MDNPTHRVLQPIIQVKDLSFAYKKENWILKDVSFSIQPGEIVAIAGQSGIGKTTMGFILKGLIPHTIKGKLKGSIQVAGWDVKKTKIVKLAKAIGMVFQDLNSQLFSTSVQEEVEFGLRNLKLNLEWGLEAMEFLGIANLRERMPMNLSAGQKQRVILAAIIATHPKVLILDEPSAHLDKISKIGLKNLLMKLNHEYGTTILIIEQDPWILGEMCQSILHVEDCTIRRTDKNRLLEKKPQWSWKT